MGIEPTSEAWESTPKTNNKSGCQNEPGVNCDPRSLVRGEGELKLPTFPIDHLKF
jgi:hypothetical protein